jgi:crotonobetainyl-CoA:carnitine CoA-transferase CaiB-like acyl-CoA transferase
VLMATQSHVLAAPYGAGLFHRMSGGHSVAGIDVRMVWPCKDGHALVMLLFGPSFGPYTARLMAWIGELGLCSATLADDDWISYGGRLFSGAVPVERYEEVKSAVGELCAAHTKDQLLDAALARRLLIAPVVTTTELTDSVQLAHRGSWEIVSDPGLIDEPVRAPGSFIRTTRDRGPLGRAPRLGEHGAAAHVLAGWLPVEPMDGEARVARRAALDGLRVVDLTWALSGPATARFLSDFGATVVHIESANRVDSARTVQPYLHDISTPENAAVYHNMNVGKLSLSLNLACTEGRAVLDDLIRWADVLIESFSPRGRLALGLDHERVAGINPCLVMMSSCLFGQHGPLSAYAGFGNMAAAMTGFFELTGWSDRPPAGPFSAYTDYVSPRFSIAALLVALDERRTTGRGQYLDFAQAEAALHFLVPAILDQTVNGRIGGRHGNDDVEMVPHGIYPSAGEDRWIAIVCRDDIDWRALAGALGRSDLADLDRPARHGRRGELDAIVAAWTLPRPGGVVEALLIGLGVPAHVVQHSPECADDPQLLHQQHLLVVEHPQHGAVTVEASRVDLSETPSVLVRGAPTLGLHTVEVLTDLLGYDDDRIGALYASGALD